MTLAFNLDVDPSHGYWVSQIYDGDLIKRRGLLCRHGVYSGRDPQGLPAARRFARALWSIASLYRRLAPAMHNGTKRLQNFSCIIPSASTVTFPSGVGTHPTISFCPLHKMQTPRRLFLMLARSRSLETGARATRARKRSCGLLPCTRRFFHQYACRLPRTLCAAIHALRRS
jgi:hypothetical protein